MRTADGSVMEATLTSLRKGGSVPMCCGWPAPGLPISAVVPSRLAVRRHRGGRRCHARRRLENAMDAGGWRTGPGEAGRIVRGQAAPGPLEDLQEA